MVDFIQNMNDENSVARGKKFILQGFWGFFILFSLSLQLKSTPHGKGTQGR